MVSKQKTAAAMARGRPFGNDHRAGLIDSEFKPTDRQKQYRRDNWRPIDEIVLELDAKMRRAGR